MAKFGWRWCALVLLALGAMASAHAQEFEVMERRADSPLDRPLSELHHTAYPEAETSVGAIGTAAESPDGFLWLGGSSGLLRFDGAHFEAPYAGRLPQRQILALYSDAQDGLWVGYRLGGLSHVQGDAVNTIEAGEGIPDGSLFSILRAPDGRLWIATTSGVARLVDGRWQPVGEAEGYGGHQPESMMLNQGVLWILDVAGAWHLDPGTTRFQRMDHDQALQQGRERLGQPVRSYHADTDGNGFVDSSGAFWLGTDKGFERHRWLKDANGQTHRITERFSQVDGLTSNRVHEFFEDRSGNVWALTDGGVDQFRASKLRPVTFSEVLQSPAVERGEGNRVVITRFWFPPVSTDGHALDTLVGLPDTVTTMTRDRDGGVWMAGIRGLSVYRHGRVESIPLPEDLKSVGTRFQSLAFDDEGTLWVSASAFGLYRWKDGDWSKETGNAFPVGPPTRMLNDGQGSLWFAYPHNVLLKVDSHGMTRFGSAQGLSVGNPMALGMRGGHVWVGGDDGVQGLEGGRFVTWSGEGGEHFRGITGIVETASGDLWLSGLDGAYRIAAADMAVARAGATRAVPFQYFGHDDGRIGSPDLMRPLPSLVEGADGKLWFTTTSSVAWLDPQKIMRNTTPPTVVIDDIASGDFHHAARGVVQLPALTRRVEFRYSAASLTNAQRTRFFYRLEGVDDDWQDAGRRRTAFYTNLEPGSYRFLVRAINEDGVVSKGDAQFAFAILPAWYQTTAFRIVCVLLILVMMWLAYLARMRSAQETLRVRLEALHGERERIARELHDTLLQSVQGLLLRLQVWSGDESLPPHRRQEMRTATAHAREMIMDGRDRIVTLRQHDAPPADLADALRIAGNDYAFTFPAMFFLDEEGKPLPVHADIMREVIEIGREALRNAFVHAEGSEVRVHIRHWRRSLEVVVRDNGRGIDEDVLAAGGRAGHWGMAGMRERAARIGAHLMHVCPAEGGTRVRLVVPRHLARWRPRRKARGARGAMH
ncbi:sensor histidine kinase [Dyella sp. C11]|uniref:sensor histidine kinase n=1 Tax=Dyella sp. C11 TaxID=2126991 RepID=UPI0018E50AEB|nr:sensor histidine kinase [Dyella sp. C11]